MKTTKLITLPFFFYCFTIFGQTGYLGNKNVVSINMFANMPLIGQDRTKQQFKQSGDEMIPKKEIINYGFGLEYTHALSKRFGIGLELNQKTIQIASPDYFILENISSELTFKDTVYYRSTPLAFNNICPTFKFEFYNKEGVGNIGIVHSIGIGAIYSRVRKKTYAFSLNEFGNSSNEDDFWTKAENYYFEQEWGAFYGINANYAIFMRYPISDRFSLNFGLKSMLNVYFKPNETIRNNKNNSPYVLNDTFYSIQKETLINIHFNAGICYHF
jgi:hypothetical protein